MPPPVSDRWTSVTWSRTIYGERLTRPQIRFVREAVEGVDDDIPVELSAGLVRDLLAPHLVEHEDPGAAVHDEQLGVTYRATIGRAPGRVYLRTVEVVPDDEGEPDVRAFRIPTQALADAVAVVVAESGPDMFVYHSRGHVVPDRSGVPTPEQLCADLLGEKANTRQALAAKYHRSLSRIDDWLGAARRERPDLPWPAQRRGRKPQRSAIPTAEQRGEEER